MKKLLVIFIAIMCIGSLVASEKKEIKMSEKLIQVEIISEQSSKDVQIRVNNFLVLRKIKKEEIIDIKFTRSDNYKSAMIIYEINGT